MLRDACSNNLLQALKVKRSEKEELKISKEVRLYLTSCISVLCNNRIAAVACVDHIVRDEDKYMKVS